MENCNGATSTKNNEIVNPLRALGAMWPAAMSAELDARMVGG